MQLDVQVLPLSERELLWQALVHIAAASFLRNCKIKLLMLVSNLVASLLLVAMPFAPSSFLLLLAGCRLLQLDEDVPNRCPSLHQKPLGPRTRCSRDVHCFGNWSSHQQNIQELTFGKLSQNMPSTCLAEVAFISRILTTRQAVCSPKIQKLVQGTQFILFIVHWKLTGELTAYMLRSLCILDG